MSKVHTWTASQKTIARALAEGMIIRRYGNRGTHSGFAMFDADGRWVCSASKAALKTLAGYELVVKAGDRLYFTTRGYWSWFGGAPKGEAAELCALADAHLEYVKSMVV